ncbi:hypothetical protein GOP47_0019821 [Adiantum capillus-veneris]|uniref:Uncharacterized protein n=1 Tax=Adiantum capillus-veneris TaxID=13818 RepID=A0A9D4ZA03_ADICA|nr:hypothetical protein GOP47_0019821 [Adiantum capillus-veneris]
MGLKLVVVIGLVVMALLFSPTIAAGAAPAPSGSMMSAQQVETASPASLSDSRKKAAGRKGSVGKNCCI